MRWLTWRATSSGWMWRTRTGCTTTPASAEQPLRTGVTLRGLTPEHEDVLASLAHGMMFLYLPIIFGVFILYWCCRFVMGGLGSGVGGIRYSSRGIFRGEQ